MKERIQKVLAAVGIASRRAIEEMVLQGRITVNGKTMVRLPIMVEPGKDKIEVDGEKVKFAAIAAPKKGAAGAAGGKGGSGLGVGGVQMWYLMMNKPRGYVCSNVAQGVQKRAIDLLPPEFAARVYPVGRLDAESKGLLLLTNDGELTNLLTHPRYGVPKTYRVIVDGRVAGEAMTSLENGVFLVDKDTGKAYKTQKCVIKVESRTNERTTLNVTLKEGRNRQIRRMLAKVGFDVRDLVRTHFGPLKLDKLPVGAVRPLKPDELKTLQASVAPEKVAKHQKRFKRLKKGETGDSPMDKTKARQLKELQEDD